MQAEQTSEREQTTWSEMDWAAAAAAVRRLQGRIYRAAAAGTGRQVMSLPKLLVRFRSAKRFAICRMPSRTRAGLPLALMVGCIGRLRTGRGWPLACNRPTGQPATGTRMVAFPCPMGGSGTRRRRLKPDDEQSSRPVLRGPSLGNEARLPDASA